MSDYGDEGEAEDEGPFIGEYEGNRNERNERHGYGKTVLPNKDMYEGRYMNGKRDGYGVYKFKSKAAKGARYLGEYYQGRKQGFGVFIYPDGSKYEGHWVNDLKEGTGKYCYVNGDTYDGDWYQDVRHGHGKYTYKGSNLKYEGSWYKGKFDGYGSFVYPNYKYNGRFRSNKAFGQGKFVFDTSCEVHGKYTLPSKREAAFTDIEQEAALMAIERALAGDGEDGEVNLDDLAIPGTPPPIEENTGFIQTHMTELDVLTPEEEEEARLVAVLQKMKKELEEQLKARKQAEQKKAEEEAARLARLEAERAALENQAADEPTKGEEEDEGPENSETEAGSGQKEAQREEEEEEEVVDEEAEN